MAKIDAFFKLMHEQGASDLHLVAGQPPALRIRGEIERVKYNVLTSDHLAATRSALASAACDMREPESGRLLLQWPDTVGGMVIFQQAGTALPAFD